MSAIHKETKKLFGTDGVRGRAGEFPLDATTVYRIGRALAQQLKSQKNDDNGAPILIVTGRDGRESGAWIEEAFAAGAQSAGAGCESAGVITTPGVAYLINARGASAGAVISASHNPFHDNGIKVFTPSGRKIDDKIERLIEAEIAKTDDDATDAKLFAASFDTTRFDKDAHEISSRAAIYLEHLANDVADGLRLDDMKIVLDCANGAASFIAPALFERLGAQLVTINNQPDGRNINRACGSLHMEGLQQQVAESGADIGIAFDGDADRALFVDQNGRLVNGDATLWILANYLSKRNLLAASDGGKKVVATVMSNIGLEIALREHGIELVRTDVGDKYVLEALLETGATVGGEQSGHIILPHESLVGDGLRTSLCVLRAMRDEARSLDALVEGFMSYPQTLLNVAVREKIPFDENIRIAEAARAAEEKLNGRGRLLLRYSGTEPLARVMIEGEDQTEIELLAGRIAEVIMEEIGAS